MDLLDLAKTGIAALSTYASYKDQKRKNELQQQSYDDYMKQVADATQAAEASIAANLTPMVVSGTPTTKADVTDYTAATGLRHGGISGLRKGYARGPEIEEVEMMDEEVVTPYDLKMEEGVNIGQQVFYNTGDDRRNALMVWDAMSTPDKSIFDFDFEIFFNEGGWRDMIKGEAPMPQGETQMASAPSMGASQNEMSMQLFNKPYNQLNEMELEMFQEEMLKFQSKYMATGGIAGLRNGGRPGYNIGTLVEEEYVDTGDTTTGNPRPPQDDPAHQAYREIFSKFMEKFPGIATGEETIEEMIAMLQAEEVMEKDVGILGLNSAMDMITPQSAEKSAQKISMGDTQYGDIPYAKGGRIGYRLGTPDTMIADQETILETPNEEIVTNDMEEIKGQTAGPDWYIKRIEHLMFLGYDYDEAGEIAYDSDRYYEIVGMESKGPVLPSPEDPINPFAPKPTGPALPDKMMAAQGGRAGYRYGDQVGITAIPRPVMDPRGLRSLPAMATKDGMMDLGGLEKDYRFDGGFVPIGAYEKKDDVPARLSKNEFVFTADAVRAAGGGSINKGAKRMYETMKNLEAKPEAKRMTA